MKLYEVKALAHETQSRIRQDLNSWNDFLEHASRVYRYRFMDQILIYAQRPDAVACATMNIWNSKMGCWIKKGNRGIALIDESNSRKLKYVWDVTSVVPKMGGHLPRLWIRKPYHTETIQNRLLKVYGLQPQTDKYDTKEPSIEHTMDYLVEYLADEYAADIAQDKYSSDNSPLSELDEEKYKMDEYRRNVRVFFRYGLNRMIKERMGLSTGGFPDYDMSFIKDMPESDFCELSSRMTDAAQQALREVGIAVLTYDRVHGIDRDPSVDYNALKRKSAEREEKTYGTRIHKSRGLRDTEPYTEQGTTGATDEIRTYAQDLAQKELQGEVRYDANVRGTSGTLPKGTEESTGRDGQNRAADEKTGRSDRAAEDAGPAEMDTNDEQHPEQGRGNSEGYSDLHFIENEIVPESGTGEDEYVPESGTGLYFMPELPTEDEQRIKVEKYDYLNPRKADYIPHDYIKQVILRGTGFEGGFDRVVQIFQNEMEAGKRTALIKKEYGLGGASWPVDGMGLHGYDTYGSQGIRFQWRDEQGEAEGTLSWSSVEQEIGTLILTGEYKSRDRQNNDIIPEAEESDNISQTTEMQEQSTDKYKSEAPEQLSFTDLTNIEPDKTENDTQPEALDETEAEQKDNAEQQNNEDFTERAADYTALLVLAEADASTLTKRQKAQRNISALKILKQIENEKRPATADERTIMSAYLGWGGIPEIFDAENASWSEEYGILKSLLTTTEYDSARASTLNAHFTDKSVIDAMYKVLNNLGFTKGNILEPSMGIGNFFSRLPADMNASKLYGVELGATWINAEYIEQFMKDVLHTPQRLFSREWVAVKFAPINCEWNIKGKNADSYNPLVTGTYGTGRINAYQILENTLNLKDVKVYDRILQPDGSEKRVINREQTMLASQKQDALKEAFKDWIFRDPERREVLVKKYNELFNSSRPRTYDGSHLKFPGMTPDVELKPHQLNAVAHVMYGDNTLLAHCVGAGKTFEMIASAMESKRLGLCHKSLFVVPNHLTEQWAGDFLRLYPGANILAATEKDFEPARRKRFCARIATGDYDAVIIGHTQFAKIPLSDERQKRLMQEQIDEITESISEAKASNGEHFTIKQMEKTKKNLEVRLAKLNDAGRKDNAVTFEQLGVDRLFVDESQEFKNLFLFTKMRNVAGISQNDSQKASDMYGKCRYIDEITGGRGITFATGTPISNSMTELYTNMRYLQAGRLKELGFENFDAWASTFGETQTAIELAPEGTGYRAKTRFAKFFNLPELISLFKESADIQTADMLKLPVPECDYENVVLKPSVFQQDIVKSLGDRAENIRKGGVDSSIDNMLKVTSDGRKCAIDQRLINPDLPDNENSKVNACAARAYDIWKETAEDKSTQLIFCDASTPRSDGGFDVYHAIKDKLIAKGVPDKEIAFIHDANTKKQKAELFSKVRSGQVRFLLGSTAKMGAGTNVQTRLIALHHIDVPWRPSDIEQQEGRILRQGNRNERVKIFRYVTENTFDSYSWQLIENKQKFIGQIMTSKSPVRSCDDVDEAALSYAEVKALATGNPYIKEKMTLDTEVAKLKLLKANFKSQKYRLEDAINKEYPVRIAKLEEKIEGLRQDIITRGANQMKSDEEFAITVNGMTYTDKKDGGAALIAAVKDAKSIDREKVGRYCGFDLYGRFDVFENGFRVFLQGKMEHILEISSDPHGMITRLNNCMASFDRTLTEAEEALADTCAKLETAKTEVTKEFDKEDILSEKLKRLSFLNAQLDADRKETPQNAPQNKQAQRNDIKEKYIKI